MLFSSTTMATLTVTVGYCYANANTYLLHCHHLDKEAFREPRWNYSGVMEF